MPLYNQTKNSCNRHGLLEVGLAANVSRAADHTFGGGLLVGFAEQGALVELLGAGRYIQRRVLVEKVDRLQADFNYLTWHDWEVLNAWHL